MLLHDEFDFFNIGIDKPEISVRELAEIYAAAGKEKYGYTGKVTYQMSDE